MQSQSSSNRLLISLSSPWRSRDTSYVLLVVSLIVFAKNFWLDEDAHIPFRSLAQLQAGNGAVWNLGERVQVTTSAAWYWLLAAANVLLHDVIGTTIVVTALLFVVLLALARRIYGDTPALWFLLVSFLLSKGFFDFTSSGHENILAYTVLLALYAAYRQTASLYPAPSPALDTHLDVHGLPRRFPLLLWRRGSGRGGRACQPPACVPEIGLPLESHPGLRDEPWASSPQPSPPKEERESPPAGVSQRRIGCGAPRQLYLIALLTGLVPLVRHDLSLLCVLPFAWLLWRERHHWRRELVLIALAGLPLLLWTLASLVYYGLPFPNTAYAKVLKHGFAANIILKMGLDYFCSNARHDPLTMLIIAVAPVVAFWKLQSWQRAFALGVVLYCLYLCKIGGDYVAGRFLSVPFLVAALLVADWLSALRLVGTRSTASPSFQNARDAVERVPTRFRPSAVAWTALATTAAYLWLIPATPLLTPWTYGRDLNTLERLKAFYKEQYIVGAQDSRAVSYSRTLAAWWRNEQRALCGDEFLRRDGETLRRGSDKVVKLDAIGQAGYYAGLKIHIVDSAGIADPFLAQLPSVWLATPGALTRDVPDGYLDHLRDGVTPIRDPQLNRYYQQIELLTRSRELFSSLRLKTIVAFNLGRYEPLLDAYRREVAERHGLNPLLKWTHKSADN
jgi:hypothetical protein